MKNHSKSAVRAALLIVLAVFGVASHAYAQEECLACHGEKTSPLFVDKTLYGESVHGALPCQGCHVTISKYPHGNVRKVDCGICHTKKAIGAPMAQALQYEMSVHGRLGKESESAPRCQTCHGSHYVLPSKDPRSMTYRKKVPALCAGCHRNEYDIYKTSIHGTEFIEKDNMKAADCFDCHEEHLIPNPEEKKWKLWLISECGSCHKEQLNAYHDTFHGKVTELGFTTVAKCSDCHGYHDILPAGNMKSSISRENILGTCRKCHPGATAGFTKYYAHPNMHDREKYPQLYYVYIFMVALLTGVMSFFLLHTLLWGYRSLKERIARQRREM
ncbi:MAG: cytochrome c3 family protein [Nitrospirota bacterium]